jgi:hypothetical protein
VRRTGADLRGGEVLAHSLGLPVHAARRGPLALDGDEDGTADPRSPVLDAARRVNRGSLGLGEGSGYGEGLLEDRALRPAPSAAPCGLGVQPCHQAGRRMPADQAR